MTASPTLHWTARLRRGLSDIWFITLAAAALLLLSILLGYHSTDPGWSTSGTAAVPQHYFGTAGAYIADTFISLFGWSCYLIPIGLLIIAWISVRHEQRETEILIFKLIALLAAVLTLSSMLALHMTSPINSLSVTGGGVIGQKMTQMMLEMLPVRGVMYINTFFFFVGILYILELNPLIIPEKIGYWVLALFGKMKSTGLAEDLAEPIPEPTQRAADSNDGRAKRNALMARLTGRAAKPPQDMPPDSGTVDKADSSGAPYGGRQEPQLPQLQSFAERQEPASLNWADYKNSAAADGASAPDEAYAADTPPAADNPFAGYDAFASRDTAPVYTEQHPAADSSADDDQEDDFSSRHADFSFAAEDDAPETLPAAERGLKVRLGGAHSDGVAAKSYAPQHRNAAQTAHFYQDNSSGNYCKPSLNLLKPAPPRKAPSGTAQLAALAPLVEEALKNYRLDVQVVGVDVGPVVTRLELDLAPGIKVSQIINLDKDIARSLSVKSVRVVDVIPGKPYIGLEIPNAVREVVSLRSMMESAEYQNQKSPLTLVLGADIAGRPTVANLAKMPHLLVAGTTGSGKSVAINVMLASMLYKASPEELKLILIDPKMLEMSMYEDIPHLLTPVVTDMNDAENALRWAVAEMERRYQLMAAFKVRSIAGFNQHISELQAQGARIDDPLWNPEDHIGIANQPPQITTLPYIVIVIDELADMMMAVGKSVEQLIARIAQKARAAGIHLILATQRPSVDVITGLIKANVPTRLAFQVSSKIDSRTIIDGQGAETLLGYGDGLYVPPGSAAPERVHGAFIEDSEVDALTTYLKTQGQPHYEESITNPVPAAAMGAYGAQEKSDDPEQDPLYDEACQIVIESGKASISYLQRRLQVGYNRAARMIEQMEYAGLVSSAERGQRKVLHGGDD